MSKTKWERRLIPDAHEVTELVSGHSLVAEGAPHDGHGQRWRNGSIYSTGGAGSAKCSCGQTSLTLTSSSQRKRWHRQHKAEVLASQRMEQEIAKCQVPPVSSWNVADPIPDGYVLSRFACNCEGSTPIFVAAAEGDWVPLSVIMVGRSNQKQHVMRLQRGPA